MAQRHDLSLDFIKKTCKFLSGNVLKDLVAHQTVEPKQATKLFRAFEKQLDKKEVNDLVDTVTRRFYQHKTGATPEEKAHQDFVTGKLSEESLIKAIEQEHDIYVKACLALLANLPLRVIDKAIQLQNGKAIVSIVAKAGMTMRLALLVQRSVADMTRGIVYPKKAMEFPLTEDEMAWQLQIFSELIWTLKES